MIHTSKLVQIVELCKILATPFTKFREWCQLQKFNFALGLFQSRFHHAEFVINGQTSFLKEFTVSDTINCYNQLCRIHGFPNVGFHSFVAMLQSGKRVVFQKGAETLEVLCYTYK